MGGFKLFEGYFGNELGVVLPLCLLYGHVSEIVRGSNYMLRPILRSYSSSPIVAYDLHSPTCPLQHGLDGMTLGDSPELFE